MDKGRWQAGFLLLLVLLIIGGVVAAILVSGNKSDLVAARSDVEDFQGRVDDLQQQLDETNDALARLRKKYRATKEDVITAAEVEAFAVEGLSADGTNFTCLDFRCLAIKATLTFSNDTDAGSPVTCVLVVHHANGKDTHATFTSPYVPPQGEDNQVWYYYSPLSGTEIDTYNIGDCRRDEAPDQSGGD